MSDSPPESPLARWSRRKRQAALPASPALPALPAPPAPAAVPEVEIPPPAETIPLEDIAGWLGRAIPEGWREVALRRVWLADTAIRDFVGPADYAWDWNTPGGAPGWGPLRAADDMVRLLARAMGEDLPDKPVAEPTVEAAVSAADPPPDAMPPERPADPRPEPVEPPRPRRGGKAAPV